MRQLIILTLFILMAGASAVAKPQSKMQAPAISLEQLLGNYAEHSGEKVLADPRVKGRVAAYGMDMHRLSYAELVTILNVHNFATFKSAGMLVVVPSNVAKQNALPIYDSAKSYADADYVSDVIVLQKLCPRSVREALAPLISPVSHFHAHQESRTLVITTTVGNLKQLKAVLNKMEANAKAVKSCA